MENQEAQNQEQEVDYKALYEQAQVDLQALAAKKDELLTETKKAKSAYKELEMGVQQKANQEAKDNGDYERLLKNLEQERDQAFEELKAFKGNMRQEKINNSALKIASDLKARPESAEILGDYVARELSNLADEHGMVSETAINAVKNQFLKDDRFKPLLQGSLSNGGGAVGGKSSALNVVKMTRSEFNRLPSAQAKADFMSKVREGKAEYIDD